MDILTIIKYGLIKHYTNKIFETDKVKYFISDVEKMIVNKIYNELKKITTYSKYKEDINLEVFPKILHQEYLFKNDN